MFGIRPLSGNVIATGWRIVNKSVIQLKSVLLSVPPIDVDMEPDRIHKDIPIYQGAVGLDVVGPDPGTWS